MTRIEKLDTSLARRRCAISKTWIVLVVLVALSPMEGAGSRGVDWRQVHAEITVTRTGTMGVTREGHFDYKFEAKIDQLMQRLEPQAGQLYPRYKLPSKYERASSVEGTTSLTGLALRHDEASEKIYHVNVSLTGTLTQADDLQLVEVSPSYAWQTDLGARFQVHSRLKGAITTDLPLAPGYGNGTLILLWPSLVNYSDTHGYYSEGHYWVRPALGAPPTSPLAAASYKLFEQTNALDSQPAVASFKPQGIGAVTRGDADAWEVTFNSTSHVELPMGGAYDEQVTVVVRPADTTLPIPALKAK